MIPIKDLFTILGFTALFRVMFPNNLYFFIAAFVLGIVMGINAGLRNKGEK